LLVFLQIWVALIAPLFSNSSIDSELAYVLMWPKLQGSNKQRAIEFAFFLKYLVVNLDEVLMADYDLPFISLEKITHTSTMNNSIPLDELVVCPWLVACPAWMVTGFNWVDSSARH